jgi:CRISPR system Cascade subunit CasE
MTDTGAVLVQSEKLGHWNLLDEFPGYVATLQADKPLNIEKWAVPGRHCRFRLAANPTVTRDGKRLGLLKEEQQLTWLSRQGQRGGFDIVGAICSSCDRINVPHGNGGARLTVTRVQFDGELIAREPAVLHRTLQAGIGHAKALGLGLLSLAPV